MKSYTTLYSIFLIKIWFRNDDKKINFSICKRHIFAKDTISVNFVATGTIETNMNKEIQENNMELERLLKQTTLLE